MALSSGDKVTRSPIGSVDVGAALAAKRCARQSVGRMGFSPPPQCTLGPCRRKTRALPGSGNTGGSAFVGIRCTQLFFQLPACVLDHVFGDRDFLALFVDDCATYRLLRLLWGNTGFGRLLLRAHELSPHQVVCAV